MNPFSPDSQPSSGGEDSVPDSEKEKLPDPELPAEGEEETEEIPAWNPDPDKLLCALLFATHEYQSARTLREIMGDEWDTPRLRQLMKGLNRSLGESNLPFEVVEVEGTFRIRTLPKYFSWVRKLFKDPAPRRLSQAALETLAIVAYKQPITKAEIEAIRGVHVDGSLKTLLDKKLIDIGRRADAMGNAFTYHTTRDFLRYFGISRIPEDLPRLAEFEGILNAQTLIPQINAEGEALPASQTETEPEQMSLGMESDPVL